MRAPPPEVLAAAHLITKWAAENNIRDFAIDGIQQRVRQQRAVYSHGVEDGPEQKEWVISWPSYSDETPKP